MSSPPAGDPSGRSGQGVNHGKALVEFWRETTVSFICLMIVLSLQIIGAGIVRYLTEKFIGEDPWFLAFVHVIKYAVAIFDLYVFTSRVCVPAVKATIPGWRELFYASEASPEQSPASNVNVVGEMATQVAILSKRLDDLSSGLATSRSELASQVAILSKRLDDLSSGLATSRSDLALLQRDFEGLAKMEGEFREAGSLDHKTISGNHEKGEVAPDTVHELRLKSTERVEMKEVEHFDEIRGTTGLGGQLPESDENVSKTPGGGFGVKKDPKAAGVPPLG
jgi:hypothetical protein